MCYVWQYINIVLFYCILVYCLSAAFTWLCRRSYWRWDNRRALIGALRCPSTHPSSPPTQTWTTRLLSSLAPPPALSTFCSCLLPVQPSAPNDKCVKSVSHQLIFFQSQTLSLSPVQSSTARVLSLGNHKHILRMFGYLRELWSGVV